VNQINKKEFLDILSEEFALSDAEAKRLLEGVLKNISQILLSGQRVYFREFGFFDQVLRPPKKFRNISTGKIETLPAYYDINFKPSKSLLKKLNKNPPPLEPFERLKQLEQLKPKEKKPKRKITFRKLIKLFT